MKIIPISYDSFSVRSMFTYIKTDIKIFIDPSVAIGPYRYGLKPHKIELKELEDKKDEILKIRNIPDIIIITHYHWDHCPNPNEKHFEILYNKKLFIKDFNTKINNSQNERGKNVYNKIKNRAEIYIADNKEFEINNTYIKFYVGIHGEENSKLGYVLEPYIQYKDNSLLFGSDIQGILNDYNKNIILNANPDIFILSGPPFYHNLYDRKNDEIFFKNIKEIVEKTNIKEIIIDHHSARSKDYLNILNYIRDLLKDYNIKIYSAAEYKGIENRLLEANRDLLYKNIKN